MNPIPLSDANPFERAAPEHTDFQKCKKMCRAVTVCASTIALFTILGIAVLLFLVHSQQKNLQIEFNEFKVQVLREIAAQRLPVVNESINVLEKHTQMDNLPVEGCEPDKSTERHLDSLMRTIQKFNAKLEELSTKVNDSNNVDIKVEAVTSSLENVMLEMNNVLVNMPNKTSIVLALNSSIQMIASIVQGIGTELKILQSTCSPTTTLNSSTERTLSLNSTTFPCANTSNTIVEGIIVASDYDGITTIALPFLRQTKIVNGSADDVVFDWSSRKVYWTHEYVGIKKGNLDGTDVKLLVPGISLRLRLLAVDSVTGNFYYQNRSQLRQDINVCCKNGKKCSVVATNPGEIHCFALYPSKSLMFWANDTFVIRANMDGTNARVILSEKVRSMAIDETLERLHLISEKTVVTQTTDDKRTRFSFQTWRYIISSDLNGNDRRALWNTTEGLGNIRISGDCVYFSDYFSIQSGNKVWNLSFITHVTLPVRSFAFYGVDKNVHENPCNGSICSHLCVLKLESFACLCPQGQYLENDGTTCV